jgi:hypothetical protein
MSRLPVASRLTPSGLQMPVALGAGEAFALAHTWVVKLVALPVWPKTRSAVVSPAPVAGLSAASG